ncbi:membrane protein [Spirochaetia bacterium]|nr:membrane protein [Spirochaetia bacterium]
MTAEDVKISFLSKEEYLCPVCETSFHREELLSGSGRLIAGKITDELHRLYEPSAKFGVIYPLAYQVTVCPECWFASMDKDFTSLTDKGKEKARAGREKRIKNVRLIFPSADFKKPRDLLNGAASLYLALCCYDYYSKEFSPTMKQAVTALRTGWLLDELAEKYPGYHYDWLARLFKKKSQFLYNEAIFKEQNGKENLSGIKNFGPDTDKNYSYEGALYLSALLKLKYGPRENAEARAESLGAAKRTIAKIFGLGKSSKSKPGPLLEHARNLYDNINKELNETDE